jgi:prepilin-type N-terminal cleavage/methylation domain-containing protein
MRRHGTSMVELLIVLTLLGIMTAIAGPRVRPSAKHSVEQNARLLAQDLDHARTKAFGARTRVRVALRDTSYRLYLDDNRDTVFAENVTERTAFGPMNRRYLESHVIYGRGIAPPIPTDTGSVVIFGTRRIQFGPRGTTEPFGSSAVLYFTHSEDSSAVSAVEINPSANVRVWRWVDGSWI